MESIKNWTDEDWERFWPTSVPTVNPRAEKAETHNSFMQELFLEEITNSIQGTRLYDVDVQGDLKGTHIPQVILDSRDVVSSVMEFAKDGKTAVMNFANYTMPGGGYLSGAMAQEEAICHESTLYPVLEAMEDSFYGPNRTENNDGLYTSRMLYSPDIVFHKGGYRTKADVITCAAPNKTAYMAVKSALSAEEKVRINSSAIRDRIRAVLQVANSNKVKTLIAGAFGCGVFGQNPFEVAGIFRSELASGYYQFDRVVFSVMGSASENYLAFKDVFSKKGGA